MRQTVADNSLFPSVAIKRRIWHPLAPRLSLIEFLEFRCSHSIFFTISFPQLSGALLGLNPRHQVLQNRSISPHLFFFATARSSWTLDPSYMHSVRLLLLVCCASQSKQTVTPPLTHLFYLFQTTLAAAAVPSPIDPNTAHVIAVNNNLACSSGKCAVNNASVSHTAQITLKSSSDVLKYLSRSWNPRTPQTQDTRHRPRTMRLRILGHLWRSSLLEGWLSPCCKYCIRSLCFMLLCYFPILSCIHHYTPCNSCVFFTLSWIITYNYVFP